MTSCLRIFVIFAEVKLIVEIQMNIRQVTLDDAKAINSIYNAYIAETTITFETEELSDAEMLARIKELSAHYPYFVCDIDGVVVGYCYAHPWKARAAYQHTYETTIYLSPAYQHQGIGSALMHRLIDECRNRGVHALIACITDGNAASNALHEKLGFEQVSHFREVGMKFGKLLDVVDYQLLV
jgi:phosphinothricin acetyltransferase